MFSHLPLSLFRGHAFQNTNKANTHKPQSVKYLPTVQKCDSSICFAKVSLLPIRGGRTETRFKRTASPPMRPACLFIKRGGGRALPRSFWGHAILPTWIHKWMVGSTSTSCRTGCWLVPWTQEWTVWGYIYWCEGVTLPRNENRLR